MMQAKRKAMRRTLVLKTCSSSAKFQVWWWDKRSLWWEVTQKRWLQPQRLPPQSRGFLNPSFRRHKPSEFWHKHKDGRSIVTRLITLHGSVVLQTGRDEWEKKSVSTVRCRPAFIGHPDWKVNLQSSQTHPAFREGDCSKWHVPCK